MSKALYVILCIFASIGGIAFIYNICHIGEWLCSNYDKLQLVYREYERMYNKLETVSEVVKLQQDEIKLLKERIDIYEEGNNKSYKGT